MTAGPVYSHTPFFSPSVKNSVFATSLVRGRQWIFSNPLALPLGELSAKLTERALRCSAQSGDKNLSVSPAGCHLSFQERQGGVWETPVAAIPPWLSLWESCRAGGETERALRTSTQSGDENLSVSPARCHLSFQERQESCCNTPLGSPSGRAVEPQARLRGHCSSDRACCRILHSATGPDISCREFQENKQRKTSV